MIITAGAAYQNYEYAKQAREEVKVLNVIIQQKDIEIAKLTKEIKVKQDELIMVRAELDSIKIALNDAKAQINKVPGQPVIQAPKTVNE